MTGQSDCDDLRQENEALRAAAADIGKKYADVLTLLNWVCNCWPGDDENWYRSDMDDCVGAIRKFLFLQAERIKE